MCFLQTADNRFCFQSHSVSLSLLIEELKSLILETIIEMCVFIMVIMLLIFFVLCVLCGIFSFNDYGFIFLSMVFVPAHSPLQLEILSSLFSLGLLCWVQAFLGYLFCGNVLFLTQLWQIVLLSI